MNLRARASPAGSSQGRDTLGLEQLSLSANKPTRSAASRLPTEILLLIADHVKGDR